MSAGRVLALDIGDVRIGVAISDPDRRIALPLGTVQVGRPPGELRAIGDLVRDNDAALVVIGEPLNMDGSHGSAAVHAESFAAALRGVLDVEIVLHDERLSTVVAARELRSAGVRARDQRAVIDAAAAQVILQSWLDAQAGPAGRA